MSTFVLVGRSTTSVLSQLQRKEVLVPVYVDSSGYIQNAGLVHQPVAALEKGSLDGPRAIVLHRTVSTNTSSPLASFESGTGTHFLIGKDGKTYQAASLYRKTHHVGPIRSRCYEEKKCTADETRRLQRSKAMAIHRYELLKPYPDRFPSNEDSVGIEVVGMYYDETEIWDAPTELQRRAISQLIGTLKTLYSLKEADVYEHDIISYKTPGEGAGLYDGTDLVPAIFPPPIF